jgi:hypothetical protein
MAYQSSSTINAKKIKIKHYKSKKDGKIKEIDDDNNPDSSNNAVIKINKSE